MKKNNIKFILFGLIFLAFSGCGSYAKYQDLAKEHDFDYFFPSASQVRTFDTQEDAYDFIMTARAKFGSSVGKALAKGLPGKLSGPVVVTDKPVSVFCFLSASNNAPVDLDNNEVSMEKSIKDAISATIVFLIFYEDRGISLASYYLQTGWVYSSSSQHSYFMLNDDRYVPEYPALWSNEKAFEYLWNE